MFEPDTPGSFLGKGMGWPPREDPNTGDLARVEDEQSISDCIRHLIHITPGVVPGDEDMGTEVEQLLFSGDAQLEANIVGESILRALRTYERRIFVLGVTFRARPQAFGRMAVDGLVRYRVRATGETVGGVFPFVLNTGG